MHIESLIKNESPEEGPGVHPRHRDYPSGEISTCGLITLLFTRSLNKLQLTERFSDTGQARIEVKQLHFYLIIYLLHSEYLFDEGHILCTVTLSILHWHHLWNP